MTSTRFASLSLALLTTVAATVAGCTGTPAPAPSSTVPLAVTLASVVVSGIDGTLTPGDVAQLRADAVYSDGSRRDVTAQSTWNSSNPQVAVVSAAGQLTSGQSGDADVTATYQQVNGRATVAVRARIASVPSYVVSGVVHENWPHTDVLLGDARIEAVGGSLDGQSFTTRADGRFALPAVTSAGFVLYFKRPGYDDVRMSIADLPRDQMLEVAMPPKFVLQHGSIAGTFQASDCTPGQILDGCRAEFPMTIRHDGFVTVESCTTHAFEDYIVWLRRDGVHVGNPIYCEIGRPYPQRWSVEPGANYTFEIFGQINAAYHATFTYPN